MQDAQTLELTKSGLRVQWNPSTQSWRMGSATELRACDEPPTSDGSWAGLVDAPAITGRAQRAWRERDTDPPASWWVVLGQVRDGEAAVALSDGTLVPVHVLGGVWVAEWVSRPQEATIHRGDETISVYDQQVHY